MNANERFALEGLVTTTFNKSQTVPNITIVWEEVNGVLDLQNAYPGLIATPYTYRNLVLRKNSLSPGQQYTFKVTASWTLVPELGETFDVVSLEANGAPSSGAFEVSPLIGHAASTRFTFKCNGWEDDSDEPVEYEFRYIDPITSEAIPLVSRSRNNEVTSILPPFASEGGDQTRDITLQAYIVDYYNAKTVVNFTIAMMQGPLPFLSPESCSHFPR